MTQLTQKQKELLKRIVSDKYSVGAFSGMVYNAVWSAAVQNNRDVDRGQIMTALSLALDVRLLLEEQAQ